MNASLLVRGRLTLSNARSAVAWTLSGIGLLTLASHVAVPLAITPVPATLQPQAVLLVAALWPRAYAQTSVFAWLAAGFIGAPVFAMGLAGGWLHLMPTAGYLLAYVPVTMLVASLRPRGAVQTSLLWLSGNALVLLLGTAWLALFVGPTRAVTLGVVPFALGDLVKTLAALAVLRPWQHNRALQS